MSTQRRFAAGNSYAVVGDSVVVVLPLAERGRVAALWELADAGASADTLIDALLAGGLSGLSDFALLDDDDSGVRIIVRGTATATVHTEAGVQHLSAVTGTTWHEQLFTSVTGGRISLGGDSEAVHPLTEGLARVSAVEFGMPFSMAAVAGGEPVAAQGPAPAAPVAPTGPELTIVPEPEPEPEPPAVPEREPEPTPEPAPEPPAVPDHAWSDRDGQTVSGEPTPDFERPPIAGQEMAPDVVSRPVASLVFSTGDVIEVDRTVLIGRAPEARQFASHDQPRVVTVSSPNQEISSTHLEIRPGAGADHGSAIATDLGSTNGTILVQPGLASEELKAGIAVSLIPGAVLDLGDGVTIQVTTP